MNIIKSASATRRAVANIRPGNLFNRAGRVMAALVMDMVQGPAAALECLSVVGLPNP
jgi:hypothetical protein